MEDNNNSRTFSANGIDIEDDVSTEEEDLMTTVKKNPKTAGSVTTTKKKTVVKSEKSAVTKKRKRRKQKPKDYPKRPLSAYNIFFKETRERILKQNGKTNFQDMVRKIAALWKEITPEDKENFDAIASKDLIRYKEEVGIYECNMVEKSNIENEERAKKIKIVRDDESQKFHSKNDNGIASVAADAATTTTGYDYRNGDSGTRAAAMSSNFPVQNVQIPSMSNDIMTQVPSNVAPSSHTLTINELEQARRRLEGELRAIEEAQSLRQRSGFGFGTPTADAATILHASSMYGEGAGEQFCANIAAAEQQIQRRNISNILDAGEDHIMASKDAEMMKRMALSLEGVGGDSMATTINEIEMRKRLVGLSGDPSSTSNEDEIKKRLDIGNYPIVASKEEDIRKHLLREAEIRARFGMSESREEILGTSDEADIRKRLGIGGGLMTASAEVDILKRLGLSGIADYQMVTSAKAEMRNRMGFNGLIGNSTTVLDEAEIRMRLGLEGDPTIAKNEAEILRKQLSVGSMGDQLTPTVSANDAELQKRLGAIQNQNINAEHGQLLRNGSSSDVSSIGRTSQAASRVMSMGMDITYEEKFLAEERIRQQEILLAQISGSATSSLYSGLSGLGIPMSGGLGRIVPPYGGIGAPGSIGSQSLTSAADVRMASIRSGMSVPLQRLTDEELRVLSSGRRL